MSHYPLTRKALFLSEDETQALLDLCVTSSQEISDLQEHMMLRLANMMREFLRPAARDSDTWTETDSEMLREHVGSGEHGPALLGSLA